MDPTLKTIIEFRDEMREFRTETRSTLGQHSHRLNVLEASLASLKGDVGGLKVDVAGLKADVGSLKVDVAGLKGDVGGLKVDVAGLRGDVGGLKVDVAALKVDTSVLLGSVPVQNDRLDRLDARVAALEAADRN